MLMATRATKRQEQPMYRVAKLEERYEPAKQTGDKRLKGHPKRLVIGSMRDLRRLGRAEWVGMDKE